MPPRNQRRSTAPVGETTRGTTAVNRLRRVDRWVIHTQCSYLRRVQQPLCVDLGFGREPWTTAEWHSRMTAHIRPDISVLGLEIDQERVAAAAASEAPGLTFARGGFEVPTNGRPVHVLRAFNVLRQYDEQEVLPAWQLMATSLDSQGVLIDGTCDEIGRLATWIAVGVSHTGDPVPMTLTLSAQVSTLGEPSRFATRLPKSLIHRNEPGTRIHDFLRDFDVAWATHAGLGTFGARQRFMAAVHDLQGRGWPIVGDARRWRLGEVTVEYAAICD